jgi:exonuclease SbcC
MKTIQILSISLTNFKGLRNQKIVFNKNTDIFGANGTGKTTIMDAFLWMLFGKDSTDRKNFEIKTLDKLNVVIPQIEHEVSAVILVDDVKIEISRILSEMWPKKKGSNVAEFSGNKTEFYWDGVPMQEKTFQEKVSTILDETVFKMITNPLAFNAMKWQDQRNVLVDIAGTISDEDLAAGNSEYEKLIAELTNGKTLSDYEKQILASIKKAKEDLKMIPARIDEVSKSKPETHDFVNLKVSLGLKETELKKVDESIQNKNSAFDGLLEEINKKKSKANGIKSDIETIESNARRDSKQNNTPDTSVLDGLRRKLSSTESDLNIGNTGLQTISDKHTATITKIADIEKSIVAKREDWNLENAKELTFNDDDFHCPTCKRDFEAGDVEGKKKEMLISFKGVKANKLSGIQTQGQVLALEKTNLESELKALEERIENAKTYITGLKTDIKKLKLDIETETSKITPTESVDEESVYQQLLSGNHQYQDKKIELKNILATIDEVPKVDISELQTQRAAIVQEIDNIKSNLRNEDQIKAVDDRVKVLEKEQKDLAQQIANVEKTQFVIEKFNKLKIDTLESKINEKFKFVKFRMFKSQINGGETECCDALIDGVPFSDANTASKINAGLDIINTLCEFYQVTAPIFIDNRESIIDVIELNSQLINLIVSGEDKKLRVA